MQDVELQPEIKYQSTGFTAGHFAIYLAHTYVGPLLLANTKVNTTLRCVELGHASTRQV